MFCSSTKIKKINSELIRFAPNTIGLWSESCPLGGNAICSLAGRSAVSHLGTSGPSELDLSKKSMFRCDIWVLCPCGCIPAGIMHSRPPERSLLMKFWNSHFWRRKNFFFFKWLPVISGGHRKLAQNLTANCSWTRFFKIHVIWAAVSLSKMWTLFWGGWSSRIQGVLWARSTW